LAQGYDSEILTASSGCWWSAAISILSQHQWSQELIEQRLKVFAERGAEGVILINTHV